MQPYRLSGVFWPLCATDLVTAERISVCVWGQIVRLPGGRLEIPRLCIRLSENRLQQFDDCWVQKKREIANQHTQNRRGSVSLFCALALFSQITLFIQTIWRFGSLEMQKINIRSTDRASKTNLTILTVVARNWSFSRNVESCPLTWTQLARFTYSWLIRAAHISSLIGFSMTNVLFSILHFTGQHLV